MTLYNAEFGRGDAVVLIHGWGTHGGVWTEIARELARDYRVVVPDLPGHGRSRDDMPSDYTPESLVDLLRAIVPAPAVWVGWSLGGQVALAAARDHPGAISRLVLVGATPKYVQGPDWPHALSATVLQQFADSLAQDYAGTLERFLTLQMAAGEDRAVLRRLREEMFRYREPSTAALHAGLRLLQAQDLRASLAGIAQPTLVVHGARDRLAPPGAARHLAQHLPHGRLEIVPGAGHAPFLSHADHFIKKLRGFLNE